MLFKKMILGEELQELITLVSNLLEAFTAALFLVKGDKIVLVAQHSLSDNFSQVHPMVIPMEKGGVLTSALEKELLVLERMDRHQYDFPYYTEREEIKAFMSARVNQGEGVLCVDTKRSTKFTEKQQKFLMQLASLTGQFLKTSKDVREKLSKLLKYKVINEMVSHLYPPPASLDQLQEGFSKVLAEWEVDEAMVLLKDGSGLKAVLGYGPLGVEQLGGYPSIKGTPWEKVNAYGHSYVCVSAKGEPFIMGMADAHFPSMIIVPQDDPPGLLGLASRAKNSLTTDLLDVVHSLGRFLSPSLKSHSSVSSAGSHLPMFMEGLEDALAKANETENSILAVACCLKNLGDLDRKMGVVEVEKTVDELQREFAKSWDASDICLFRGHILMGYKIHPDRKHLEAEGKALVKNLPLALNSARAEMKVVWKVISPVHKERADGVLAKLLREMSGGKGLFR